CFPVQTEELRGGRKLSADHEFPIRFLYIVGSLTPICTLNIYLNCRVSLCLRLPPPPIQGRKASIVGKEWSEVIECCGAVCASLSPLKEFTSSGSANTETTKVTGSLETKYRWTEYGLTFTEKWNTDNTLGTEITLEDQLARGLKLTFDSSFSPNTGKKNAKIKTGYKREHINLGCDMDFDIAGPSIRGALVLGYEGWLAGYQMNFETAKSRVTQSNFAVGYKTDEFQLHTNVNDGTEFGGSIYQKVNKKLETAVNLAWTAGNSNTRFGIAAKYQIDPDACFSAKVNNSSLIGLGYTQTLKPGIKLTLSALLDGKNVNAGGHKLGLGLEFQA
uniref:Non-selective voltage-gated ion channel VDAC1 n=1 Tax=Callithrix jacchus TaxID=9483 RepID=A0A8I3W4L6_CALJA